MLARLKEFVEAPHTGASSGGRILPRDDLPLAVTFLLVHEVADELLHRGERRMATSKTVRETEAEAVAFVVPTRSGSTEHPASDCIQLYSGNG